MNKPNPQINMLESDTKFPELCAFFADKCVEELMDGLKDEALRPFVTAGFELLVQRCHGAISALAGSPIERVFLRSVMLAFLRNGLSLVFTSPFRNTPADLQEYRDQVRNLERFSSWYKKRFDSSFVSKEYLDGQVQSGKMPAGERPWLEELLLLYHYLPFRDAWHVSLQPQFPKLLGNRGTRPDMLFWLPDRSDRQLLVECDGFATHGAREHFERDRQKDRALKARGFDVFRFTGRQINCDPVMSAHELFSFLDGWKEAGDPNTSV